MKLSTSALLAFSMIVGAGVASVAPANAQLQIIRNSSGQSVSDLNVTGTQLTNIRQTYNTNVRIPLPCTVNCNTGNGYQEQTVNNTNNQTLLNTTFNFRAGTQAVSQESILFADPCNCKGKVPGFEAFKAPQLPNAPAFTVPITNVNGLKLNTVFGY